MDKFSELKSAAEKYSLTLNAHRKNPRDIDAIRAWDEADAELSRVISHNETDIIIALLAELEAKDKRIAELEGALDVSQGDLSDTEDAMHLWAERAKTAEAKLATPVRLPEKYNMKMAGDKSTKSMFYGHNSAINDSAKAIRAAGFTVEGDEQ